MVVVVVVVRQGSSCVCECMYLFSFLLSCFPFSFFFTRITHVLLVSGVLGLGRLFDDGEMYVTRGLLSDGFLGL